jgi:excisionase family DNA binding protein
LEPELLSVATAAKIMGISRTVMYQLIAGNRVPVVRIGRSVRVPRRALMEWIDTASTGERITSPESLRKAALRSGRP